MVLNLYWPLYLLCVRVGLTPLRPAVEEHSIRDTTDRYPGSCGKLVIPQTVPCELILNESKKNLRPGAVAQVLFLSTWK
jgi:hypothetical protein